MQVLLQTGYFKQLYSPWAATLCSFHKALTLKTLCYLRTNNIFALNFDKLHLIHLSDRGYVVKVDKFLHHYLQYYLNLLLDPSLPLRLLLLVPG